MSTAAVTTLVPESNESTAAIERYRAAYGEADAAVAFAETVKLGGIFVAGVVFVGALLVFQAIPSERSGFPTVSVLLIVFAALLILISQVVGSGFHLQSELLKAAVDADVNSSPFLSNGQRARVMGLRKQPTAADIVGLRAA